MKGYEPSIYTLCK